MITLIDDLDYGVLFRYDGDTYFLEDWCGDGAVCRNLRTNRFVTLSEQTEVIPL